MGDKYFEFEQEVAAILKKHAAQLYPGLDIKAAAREICIRVEQEIPEIKSETPGAGNVCK